MAIKEDGLKEASAALYQGATLRGVLCSGSWAEATGTKLEIFSSEVPINYVRPTLAYVSESYNVADNTLTVTVNETEPFNPPSSFAFNRICLLKDGRELGACTIFSIVGTVVTLNTLQVLDWQIGDVVYFSNQTSATITGVDDVAKTVTLDVIPPGVSSSQTISNGFGSLLEAKAFSAVTFSTGANNTISLVRDISGF